MAVTAGLARRVSVRATELGRSQTATMLDPITGTTVRLTATLEGEDGERHDPDALTFRVLAPGGDAAETALPDAAVVRDSEGRYHLDVSVTEEGTWRYSAQAEGSLVSGVDGGQFVARPAPA